MADSNRGYGKLLSLVVLYNLFADSRAPISAPLPLLLRGFPRSSSSSQFSGRESESSHGNVVTYIYELSSNPAVLVSFLALAIGLVTLLSGQRKGGVSVEAWSVSKGYFEETVTDSSGYYRLRGLLPDTVYEVKVAKKDVRGSSNIEHAFPDSISVKVGTEDIKGLGFIVFEEPEMTVVSCHVEGNGTDELRKHLMVPAPGTTATSRKDVRKPMLHKKTF
ncbi:hypothetical protein RYX36_014224 [Vicia faba]